MIALIQRVQQASVTVDGKVIGEIKKGLLVFLAVEPEDSEAKAKRLAERVAGYRVFNDDNGKMNLNVKQAQGDILVVSQFTLAADTFSYRSISSLLYKSFKAFLINFNFSNCNSFIITPFLFD